MIPKSCCLGYGVSNLIDTLEAAAKERQRTQLHPPGLDEIEPGRVRRLEQEPYTRMSQGPQPRCQGTMDRKVIQNHDQFSSWPDLGYAMQKSSKLSTAPTRCALGIGQTRSRFKRSEGPKTLASSIVWWNTGTLSRFCPTPRRISLCANRSHFIYTQHVRLSRWGYVTLDNGPLFSANCGSGRSVKYVFSWYQRSPSSSSTRASWAREIPISSSSLMYLTKRRRLQ